MKVVDLTDIPDHDNEVALEVDVLRMFSQHINVARFFDAFTNLKIDDDTGKKEYHLWVVMEFCAYGSAARLVQNVRRPKPNLDDPAASLIPGYMPENVIAHIMAECLSGLEYLHNNKVVFLLASSRICMSPHHVQHCMFLAVRGPTRIMIGTFHSSNPTYRRRHPISLCKRN